MILKTQNSRFKRKRKFSLTRVKCNLTPLVDHVCVETCLRDPPKDRHKDTRHDIEDKSRLQQDISCPRGLSNDPPMSRRVVSRRVVSRRVVLSYCETVVYSSV
jgi:hypothetical protein